ncbi:hypothetical protein C8R47DRAFT_253815 [Mycena vitilis]|nr:hypothetical protein C8R47DRAFT_253815 [Mycena vitilis]
MSTPPTVADSSRENALWTVSLPAPPPLRRQGTLALRNATGLLLFKGSNRIAKGIVKPIVNAASRLLGRPQSVKSDIEDFFGNDDEREIFLDTLHGNPTVSTSRLNVLQRHCHKLLAFADADTVATQRLTFRIVVAVITRYPGVRCVFHSYKDLKKASRTDPPFHLLWSRPHQTCDEEWNFYRNFALFCISESTLTSLVEAEPPSKLSRIGSNEHDTWVPIESLLGYSSDGPEFQFPRLCAVLYLAGILELPGFWRRLPARALDTERIEPALEPGPERQIFFDVLRKLCNTVLVLINDTGVNKADNSVASSSAVGFARYAVDLLACSTLNGVHRLHQARNLHPCPQELPKITQDIVSAVLSYDSFVRARTLAPAITEILVSSPSTPLARDSQDIMFARSPSSASGRSSPMPPATPSMSLLRVDLHADAPGPNILLARSSSPGPGGRTRPATPISYPDEVSPNPSGANDPVPFSGADAAIMADAFKKALRKPDFSGGRAEKREGTEHDSPKATEDELLSRELYGTTISEPQTPEISRAGSLDSASDRPFSGADAAIMADAFRKVLRKPEFPERPVEKGESPAEDDPGSLEQELYRLRRVGSDAN